VAKEPCPHEQDNKDAEKSCSIIINESLHEKTSLIYLTLLWILNRDRYQSHR